MYEIDPITNLIGCAFEKTDFPFHVYEEDDSDGYNVSNENGIQILVKNELIDTVFFFLGEAIASGNGVTHQPWRSKSGLGFENSRNTVREILGGPEEYSQKIQKGYAGGYTGWWDKFVTDYGTMHITYGSDLQSIQLITCSGNFGEPNT